jgi:hypothetical protein
MERDLGAETTDSRQTITYSQPVTDQLLGKVTKRKKNALGKITSLGRAKAEVNRVIAIFRWQKPASLQL